MVLVFPCLHCSKYKVHINRANSLKALCMCSKRHLQEQKSKDGEKMLFHGGKIKMNPGKWFWRNIRKISQLAYQIMW